MSWDDHEIAWLDHLAAHDSGFLCDDPPEITDLDSFLRGLVYGTPVATVRVRPFGNVTSGGQNMGARPSQFKKGGGRLNGVDVTLVSYEFTDDILSFEEGGVLTRESWKPGKVKGGDGKMKDRFHSLNYLQTILVDGAEKEIIEPFFAGGADDFEISEDGKTVTPVDGKRELGQGTAFHALIDTLCGAGFPDTLLPEDSINYEAIEGTRVRLVQREDPNMKGKKRKAKDGKEYPYNQTVVDNVLSLPDADAAPAPVAKAGKAGAKAAPAGKVTGKGKAAQAPAGDDLDTLTAQTLIDITRNQGEADEDAGTVTIPTSKFSMAILKVLTKHPQREDVRKRAADVSFLGSIEGADYDKAAKTLTVPAEA